MNVPKRVEKVGQDAQECRREAERNAYEATVLLSIMRGEEFSEPIKIQAVDLSVSGIGIISRQMMHEGTVGVLQLLMPGRATAVVGVEVMNCRYVGKMNHRIGLQFRELPAGYDAGHGSQPRRVLTGKDAHRTFRHTVSS